VASITPKNRLSKLAKEHNITSGEEQEIREAFALFAHEKKGEKEGVISIGDVRRAMMYSPTRSPSLPLSLNIPPRIGFVKVL
jgi:Ca2+-binding EF-hand superfamily protein